MPMLYNGYDSAFQTVSELSAVGAPTRVLWIVFGVVYTILVIAFGWGTRLSAGQNKNLRISGELILLYGIVSLLWPFAPMHQRATLAAGGKTMSDDMHLALAAITVILMVAAIGFGAASFGKGFRMYSVASIVVLLIFGILTGKDAPLVQANLPTPYAGIWERINIGVFLLWIIVLTIALLRLDRESNRG